MAESWNEDTSEIAALRTQAALLRSHVEVLESQAATLTAALAVLREISAREGDSQSKCLAALGGMISCVRDLFNAVMEAGLAERPDVQALLVRVQDMLVMAYDVMAEQPG